MSSESIKERLAPERKVVTERKSWHEGPRIAMPHPKAAVDRMARPIERPARADFSMSYHELARLRLPPLWQGVAEKLPTFTTQSLPHDDAVYALRKQVLKLRDNLDIYAHAYNGDEKAFTKLRVLLDRGYEALGAYKDLFSASGMADGERDHATGKYLYQTIDPTKLTYAPKDIAARKQAVLEWQKDFNRALADGKYARMLENPSPGHLKRAPVSAFYWGAANAEPKKKLSGAENVGKLLRGMIEEAKKNFSRTTKLDHVYEKEQEKVFHDFRKRVRALLTVAESSPETTATNASAIAILDQAKTRYGELENRIVAYRLAVTQNDRPTERALAKEIDALWRDLKGWQTTVQLPAQLDTLLNAVVSQKHPQ